MTSVAVNGTGSAALDSELVLAADTWSTNGHLIAAVAHLGYLRIIDSILDPTYEKGTWWKQWRPPILTTHHRAVDGTDFRSLPYPDATFDAIAYDPPYVCPGGRATSNIKEMHDRYGMNEGGCEDPDFRTPAELQAIINDGLTEMFRLVKPSARKAMSEDGRPNGVVLCKCKDYIWSGQFWPGAHYTLAHALDLGFVLEDRFEHVGTPGPQSQKRQVHARRNLSTLFVFRKPKELR
jgi:hypothetical protein